MSWLSSRRVPVWEPSTNVPSRVAWTLALPVALPVAGLIPAGPATTVGSVPLLLAAIVQGPLVLLQFSAPVRAMT